MVSPLKQSSVQSGNLRLKDYSDADLRDIQLQTNDPLSFGEVAHEPPGLAEVLTFVAQYSADEEMVCAFGHRHKKGFVLAGSNNRIHLVGHACAKSRYGLEWDSFVASVEKQVSRQRDLAWLHNVSGEILASKSELEEVVNSPSVAAFDRLRRDLAQLPQPIAEYCRQSKWLRGTFVERDFESERKARENARTEYDRVLRQRSSSFEKKLAKQDLEHARLPLYSHYERDVMKCPHMLFRSGGKMRPRIEAIVRGLLGQAENLGNSTVFGHPDHVAKSITSQAKEFDAVVDELNLAKDFFSNKQLSLFVQWLSSEGFEHLEVRQLASGFMIKDIDSDKPSTTISLPTELVPLDINLAARFRFR